MQQTSSTEDEKLKAQYKLLEAQNRRLRMENALIKKNQELSNKDKFTITELCIIGGVSHSAYYKWLHREKSNRELENEKLLKLICELYEENGGILGYRQMTIKIRREYNKTVNYKRIYRLMQIIGLKSVCRKKRYNYIKSTPEVTAENILHRNFKAEQINEKWLTDVTEVSSILQ